MTNGGVGLASAKGRVLTRVDETEAFRLSKSLGVLEVPKDWDPGILNDDLRILHSSMFGEWDPQIDDPHFPKQSSIVRPGQRFRVELFVPCDPISLTFFGDALEFLKGKRASFLGVQGVVMLLTQLREGLEVDQEIVFVDDMKSLLIRDNMPHTLRVTVGKQRHDLGLHGIHERVPNEYIVGFFPNLR